MVVVRSPVRSCVRSVVRDVFGVVDGQTDLQRILALSPSLLVWPANGAGWQGTSGGTLSASGQPVGLLTDLAALEGKTQAEWLASAPELRSGGSVSTTGTPSPVATYNTSTGAGTANRVDVSNNSGVAFTVTANIAYVIDIENTGGAGTLNVRRGTLGGSGLFPVVVSPGQRVSYVIVSSDTTIFVVGGSDGQAPAFTLHSLKALPGNHPRAGTWASPSDAARATYVIQTDPTLYDVSGQPELVTNGDFSGGTTGWSISSATLTENSGVLEISAQSTSPVNASQSIMTFVAGRAYMVTGTYWQTGSGGTAARISLFGSTTANNNTSTPLTTSMVVVATGASATLSLASFGNASTISHFDNISIKEIPASQYKYALSFGGVDDYYSLLNAISITTNMTVVRAFKRASAGINSIGIAAATITQPHDSIWFNDNKTYVRLSGTSQPATVGTSTSTGSFVDTSRRNASAQNVRRNGVEILTGLPGTVNLALSTVGRHETGSANYNSGEISFLAVFPTELTGANLALVEQIAASTNSAVLA